MYGAFSTIMTNTPHKPNRRKLLAISLTAGALAPMLVTGCATNGLIINPIDGGIDARPSAGPDASRDGGIHDATTDALHGIVVNPIDGAAG